MQILRSEIDMANKYRVLVDCSEEFGETEHNQEFKFDHEPTNEEISAEIAKLVALKEQEDARLAEEASIVTLEIPTSMSEEEAIAEVKRIFANN